jgi:hypothetical protein
VFHYPQGVAPNIDLHQPGMTLQGRRCIPGWQGSCAPRTTGRSSALEVIEGKDRSVGNGVNPVVIFSPDYDNIKNMTFLNSIMNSKNIAVVAGQGVGKDRTFEFVGDGVGLDRRELFVDARDVVDEGLEARGIERLSEYEQALILEFDHTQIGPFQYEVDFDLGDIVTVVYPGIAQANLRIVKVDEFVTRENGWFFKLTVGNEFPDLINILRKERKNVAPELRR